MITTRSRQCMELAAMAVVLVAAVVASYAFSHWATELVLIQVVEWAL